MKLYGLLFLLGLALCVSSWLALRRRVVRSSPRLLFPIGALVVFGCYEVTRPPEWDIRIDLFPVALFLPPTLVLFVLRVLRPAAPAPGSGKRS